MKILAVVFILASIAGVSECYYLSPGLEKGTRGLSMQGWWNPQGAGGMELELSGGYGVFAADGLETGAFARYSYYEDEGENGSLRTWMLGGFLEYNVDMNMLTVPYAGFTAGYARGQAGESAVVYGPKAGMKYFVSGNCALDFSINFIMANNEIFLREGSPSKRKISASFGIKALF